MASTSLSGKEIVVVASEVVGYKSGLALSRQQLFQLLEEAPSYQRLLEVPDDRFVRVRLEEVEGLLTELLYRVGVSDSPESGMPLLVAPYARDPDKASMACDIGELWTKHLWLELDEIKAGRANRLIDPTPFLDESLREYGFVGAEIALDIVKRMDGYMRRSPWSEDRTIEWTDVKQLDDLFQSENLSTAHGQYFDQRFVNYLNQNFEDIDRINWRKFEGLAGEYLARSGFTVELGPGRNDGNIDIRAWVESNNTDLPPTLLVQCKREKKKVSKVVVKALWADVYDEHAQSGLIVTSTGLSPGANQLCKARNYPIEQANRLTLRQWLQAMRTPGSGVFLGE